jgi:hypothetical protein
MTASQSLLVLPFYTSAGDGIHEHGYGHV